MRAKTILLGKDNEVIPTLLEIHCAVDQPKILDCTYNTGKMWKGLNYKPHRMDINPALDLDTIGDFTKMPFDDHSLIIYYILFRSK